MSSNNVVSSTSNRESGEELPEDIGNLVGDSFSDATSDDSSSWMQKIDVSNFKQLTAEISDVRDNSAPTIKIMDHVGYTATPVNPTILQSFPSPDSASDLNFLPVKKERTSFESVDCPRDYGAASADTELSRLPTQSQHAADQLPVSGRNFTKPIYSYSCLIALALKNSSTGRLTVAEIYSFMWYVSLLYGAIMKRTRNVQV